MSTHKQNVVYVGKLPTSVQGQFLIETARGHGRIERQVVSTESELFAAASRDSVVWVARHGGWVRRDNPRSR